ncbi:nitrilase [Methylopila jiangsuensis]|uniref:Nitrilase n=1 Tax=Methylopila jiangsuensis TaxID=586230 RepID=A0A9W6JD62_9HYPH|nr:carbon-nitrogen hydrolase family protein [Methylopila jiangsuensis]MDR6285602.1 aliphatic nitrilase [Methylopila jiangsuensis]GLK75361.1 nitrilase [Methylopila jiangsuensis]
MTSYPKFKAAAAHLAPVFHDTAKTVDKACSVIAEAARDGVALLAFPESFIPGFPLWSGVVAPTDSNDFFCQLAAQAIRIDGPEMARVRAATRDHGLYVSLGFTEGTATSVGCLWNANVLIGPDGSILNHHRKLMPTFYEKLVWAHGDGGGLRVSETELGRIGMLICGENTNPLARFSLMAQGEQVHISTYPPLFPTKPLGSNANYDLEQAIRIRAGAHSFEAKVFNIVSSGFYDETTRKAFEPLGKHALAALEEASPSVSLILDPSGNVVSEVLSTAEGLVTAEIDTSLAVEPKRVHDLVGYYNRFDVFGLTLNRAANRPITFTGPEPVVDAPPLDA